MGANRPALLLQADIDARQLANPIAHLPGAAMVRLCDALARQFSDRAIMLTLGQQVAPHSFSDFGYASRLSWNLAGLIDAQTYMQPTIQNLVATSFFPHDRPPMLSWKMVEGVTYVSSSFIDYLVSAYMRLARDMLGENMQLLRAEFAYPARFDVARYEAFFKCPVAFNMPETRLLLDRDQLFRPSPIANPAVQAIANNTYSVPAKWYAAGRVYSAQCYFYLVTQMDKSMLNIDRMAAAFGLSERTLRRHLDEEGTNFRELLDRVRQDFWRIYHAEGTRSLGEIAELLGYSELSALSRAYKRWYGVAPSNDRR